MCAGATLLIGGCDLQGMCANLYSPLHDQYPLIPCRLHETFSPSPCGISPPEDKRPLIVEMQLSKILIYINANYFLLHIS